MTTTILSPTHEFASAVREALSDLPTDELDELTDGLEADLAERAEESGLELGDPTAYAEELRAAAGYPPRSAKAHIGRDLGTSLRSFPTDIAREWRALVAKHSILRSVVEFFVALRPVWWVLRGLAVYAAVVTVIGGSQFAATWWWAAVAAIVLSVQVGRGRMLGRAWVRWAMRISSVVAIIALPFLAGWAATQVNLAFSGGYSYDDSYYDPGVGLTQNGQQIDNIFAYDADGNPVDQVQLFDQNGQPLNLTADTTQQWWDAQDGSMLVPSEDVPGRAGWNVFPLAHINDYSDVEDGTVDDSDVSPTQFPFGTAKPLAGYTASATDGTTGTTDTTSTSGGVAGGCAPNC